MWENTKISIEQLFLSVVTVVHVKVPLRVYACYFPNIWTYIYVYIIEEKCGTSLDLFSLPKLAILFLSRNFNYSWLVDYSGCTKAFFHDADNPCLISFLFFDVFTIRRSLQNTIHSLKNRLKISLYPKITFNCYLLIRFVDKTFVRFNYLSKLIYNKYKCIAVEELND